MTDIEKINGLIDKIKTCADADLPLYLEPLVQLFFVLPKTEMNEFTDAFYQWAIENESEQSLKLFYSECIMGMKYIVFETMNRLS